MALLSRRAAASSAVFLAFSALGSRSAAQFVSPGAPPDRPAERGVSFVLASPFTWNDGPHMLGPVSIPFGPGGGWSIIPGLGIQMRLAQAAPPVSPWSSDPVLEIILWPPHSGVVSKPERFLLQFPIGAAASNPNKALVIGFHQFGVSEKNVFNGTTLPQLCAQNGWLLLAPYGLLDTNYASVDSQTALEKILDLLGQFLVFDHSRIYTVGFSMGGLNAVSFAMRHQEPDGFRVAGVIDHTGTMDVVESYSTGDAALKSLLVDGDHFGGTPLQVPFAYDRISPFRLIGPTLVDPDQARVANLLHVPFYLHANVNDPNPGLVQMTLALRNYLQSMGATFTLDLVSGGPTHNWSTMSMSSAINWISQFSLPPHPIALDEFADRVDEYLYTEVRALDASEVAHYEISVAAPANSISISDTDHLGTLAIDLAAIGLDPTQPLTLSTASLDATGDAIVLKGYATAPSQVLLFGMFPPLAWVHDPIKQEVTVIPNANGAYAVVNVIP